MKNQFALMRRLAVLLSFFAFLLQSVVYSQDATSASSLLWKVTGKGLKNPSYLFGTYHLVPSGCLEPEGKVMQAFEASKGVIVEVELDSTSLQKSAMMAYMPEHKFSELVAASDYGLVAEEVKSISGYDLQMFEQVMPVTLSLILSMHYSQDAAPWLAECQGAPLDAFFAEQGRKLGKNILALESVDEQMKLLYRTDSPEKQASDLVQIVKDKEEMRRLSAELVNGWRSEDLQQMAKVSAAMMDLYGGQTALLTDRNARWMKVLPKQFKKGPQFVAVGALHLMGDDGLIHLLRAQGYTVEAVTGK